MLTAVRAPAPGPHGFHRQVALAFVACLACASAGCRPTPAAEEPETPQHTASDQEMMEGELLPRASFDLDCPRRDLLARCINEACLEAGVEGCGRRATYIYNRYSRAWIMNSELSGESASSASAPRSKSRDAAEAPAATARESSSGGHAFTGAAGFELGGTAAALKKACEDASKEWTAADATRAKCSGAAAALGFPAEVEIAFASDKAIGITITHLADADGAARIADLKNALMKKYGAERRRAVDLPSSCAKDPEFVECLRNGSAKLEYFWTWSTGEKLLLAATRRKGAGGQPVIVLRYERPLARVDSSAL
jgi:hypothetical protein